ncbi:MAG TPA: AAA domain-containing protein, partial [Polyangium sp.]|nr:AAA domain-containing protein [Polyangium sp.]
DTAAASQTKQDLSAVTQLFEHRAELLARKLPGCSLRIGQLHTLGAGLSGTVVQSASGCIGLRDSDLRRAQNELLGLRRYVDLFARNSVWRAGRRSLRDMPDSWFHDFESILFRTMTTASEFEQSLARITPISIERLESAKNVLESARATRELRTHPEDQLLFASSLAIAVLHPDRARTIGDAEQAWAQTQDVLQRFEQRVAFKPGPTVEAAMGVLLQWGSRFFRDRAPGWWRARGLVRSAVAMLLPEKAGVQLDQPFLTELLSQARASRAWEQAEACLDALGLRSMVSNSAAHVGGLLRKASEIYRRLTTLVAMRNLLEGVQAWPAHFSAEEVAAWDHALDVRLHVLAARDAHHTAAQGLMSFFPFLGQLPKHGDVAAFLETFRRDGRRVAEADRRLAAFAPFCQDAQPVFHAFADELANAEAAAWADSLVKTWATVHLDAMERSTPELRQLDGATQFGDEEAAEERMAAIVARAAELERKRIAARLDNHALLKAGTAQPRRRRTADQATREAMLKECRKQRNVMPMRTFMRRFASEGLLDLVPVWLVSPETMTVLFQRQSQPLFDLVIFDEASQCTVESGLPVLLRAQRAVIAGDERQMPPTSFFTAKSTDDVEAGEDEEATGARELFEAESLLTLARSRAHRSELSWHYRCAHEELIAFSNYAMYDGSLLTIPSTASRTAPPAIRTVMVSDGKNEASRNEPEARVVVDVVLDLLGRTPAPTVGIVTLNIQQRQTILDEIDRRRAADRVFAERWDQACSAERLDERPFVKNLENVQGDERDIIIFSPGYAPVERVTKKGTERVVPARFGPLGQRGGERRLNVAISRAKRECIIVASFEPGMLSVARTKNEGPKLFKLFLEFAFHLSNGQRALAERVLRIVRESRPTSNSPVTSELPPGYVPLKAQIAMALQQHGLTCELDVGTSEFKVPLAFVDRNEPSRYAVAVLCDEGDEMCGAFERHVHRPKTLRDRDWKVVRVTARDWARNPNAVLARILKSMDVVPAHAAGARQ